MPLTLDEIARQIDGAADALDVLARAFAPPGRESEAKTSLWTEDGQPINLRELADELRRKAQASG
jgi:hypothetical protein